MLTLNDLSANRTLDNSTMSGVSGGYAFAGDAFGSFLGIVSAPKIDLGTHLLVQEQAVAVDQSGAVGGMNINSSHQVQNGVSGQVSLF